MPPTRDGYRQSPARHSVAPHLLRGVSPVFSASGEVAGWLRRGKLRGAEYRIHPPSVPSSHTPSQRTSPLCVSRYMRYCSWLFHFFSWKTAPLSWSFCISRDVSPWMRVYYNIKFYNCIIFKRCYDNLNYLFIELLYGQFMSKRCSKSFSGCSWYI